MSESPKLSVLTLNVWGLWLVSKRRAERVKCLAAYLKSCQEDVVLLQEVWVDSDAQLLIQAGKAAGLLHCTHFRSGVFGSGLVTLSRHPITRHAFWRYAAAGYASAISCGDFYAGKGVGWVRLATPLGEVDVFNTHLHANYCHDYRQPTPELARAAAAAAAVAAADGNPAAAAAAIEAASSSSGRGRTAPEWAGSRIPDDDDAGVRMSQLLELSEIISIVSGSSSSGSSGGGSRPVVLGGDLNCKPDTLEIDLLRLRLPALRDAWASAQERNSSCNSNGDMGSGGTGADNPEGFTCHAPGNTFQPRRQVPERIDYVWSNLTCEQAEVALQMSPAGVSYSDHFAVRAVLVDSSSSGGSSGRSAMKLRSAAAAAAADAQKQHQQGEGSSMSPGQRIATAFAAEMLLEEGMLNFSSNSGVMSALGGFALVSLVYAAVALPLLLPDFVLKGWLLGVAIVAAGVVACLGTIWLLMGLVADKSQRRALQSSYRLLRVWLEAQGLVPAAAQPLAVK